MSLHQLYLWVNVFCLFGPLILSFDKKVAFYKTWKAFLPACFITMALFIVWDIGFTKIGVWGFNPDYLIGVNLFNLPIEEWMFFFTIPYACVFSYQVIKVRLPKWNTGKHTAKVTWFLIAFSIVILAVNITHFYTASAFFLLLVLLVKHQVLFKKAYLGNFYVAYLILLIPFIIANGVLTGIDFWQYPLVLTDPSVVHDQIVWYDNEHNLGIRLFSVPLDDVFYGMALILMNVTLYEHFQGKEGKITWPLPKHETKA